MQGITHAALSHEFTHFVEELSAEKFRKFTDVLFDVLGKSDVDVNRLIDAKEAVLRNTEEYKGRSEKELRAIAYSEAVAEMMEPVLTDTDAISRISQKIKQQDRSLWGKIKDFLKGIVEKLKAAYRDMEPDSAIARLTRETVTNSEAVLDAFSEAAADAVLNYNLQETAKENGLRYSDGTFTNRNGESVDYLKSARITDKETLDFLNDQEMVTTYKTMQLVDGKLYPPMAAVIQGSYEDASELGKWEMAVEHPELIKLDKNGKPKFNLNKGKGQGSLAAAYNPYMHSSNLVLNDQFSGAYLRPNLVTVECKVPVSELTSGYKAQYAKDSVGWHSWHTGTVAGALRQQTGVERKVLLSRYIMPVRILSNAEVAGMYAELLNGTGIAVPDNVVPPALLTELEKAGVEIAESGRVKYSSRTGKKFSYQYFSQKQDVTITDIDADVGIDRKTIRNAGITSALNVGSRNKYGAVDVYVNDIGSNVVVGKDGISHGLRRENKGTPSENYIVAANAGPILKNSILINELTPKNENADGSYVLVGIAKDQYNTGYVVESIVNKFTNKLESMDVLYSMNAKKELAALNAPRATPKALPVTSSDYTVPSVLNLVKEHFPDILPEDVLKHYGYESRPDGKLGESVLYSARQETKNLVALHNLTEEKLLKSLELGGFPMPSIAITKADIPHTNFGDITVVFGKETIDPKARRENTVYSADAWTPVVPRVEYEADSKVTDRVYNRLGALKNQVAEYFQHDLDTLRYSLEDRLNRDGGEAGILENLRNNYALKAAFLEEQGTHIEQQTKQVETAVSSISSEMEDKLLNVWEALGKPTPDEIGSTSMKEIRDTYGSELEKAYPGMTKSAFRMSTVLGKLRAYLSGEANATKTSVVADGEAMKKAVDAAVDQGAFERWARELFSGIEKSKGVYNGKERFTPSGNLRSFKATHIPATLEGIVQAMRSENGGNTKNVSGFFGVKTLRAATAEEFGSIADMHRAEGRLQNLTEEQVSQIQDKLGDRLYKLMNDIDAANTKARWSDNLLIRMDSIGENLTEIGESGRYTPENVKRVFAKYGMEVSDHTAQEVVQLLFDISQMPVNIFEAKPKRAVRFEEIRNVLVPDTASQKLLRELDNRGIPYQVYEAGNEAQRQQMVSQMDDVRFSSRAQQDSEYMELAQNPEENREVLSRMVENAAREAGYDSPMLYHGTQSFGFTNFDLDKMDDKRSIFLTSNPDIAATYSGVDGSRNIGKASGTDINTLSLQEVAQMMNQFPPESGMGYQYSVVESKAEISGQVDRGLNELNNLINTLKKQYGKDSKEYGRLEKLQNTLYLGTNDGLSTQLWMILKQTDLFKGHEDFVNGLEQNLRLLKKAPESGSFLVEKALGGYSIDVLSEADAKEELAQNMQRGNYALYARLGNTLTVEGEGQRWNNLKNWAKGMEVDENSTYVMEDDGKFFLLRKADDSVVENGVIEATEKARELSPDALQFLLIQKANTSLRILTEVATTTRDVTKWAKNAGYDSVIFKNIKDSGGQNNSVSMDTTADIYAIFNPNNAKSADAVTYDDNGNVIPLSQRFDTGKEDIRYSARNPQTQVEAENERLKTELEYLKKLVQIQKRGNRDFTLDRNSLKKTAQALMNANNVKGGTAELAEILDRVYRYAGTEQDLTWEGFAEKAGEAADWLMENRAKERDPYAQQILDAVAKRRVSLNAEQIGKIEYQYGSLSEFKKAIKGSIILDQNANTSLDQLWQELSGEYPGTFDEGTTDADMPGAFADIVDELRNSESEGEAERRYYADEDRNQIIRQVYDGYWDVDPVQSVSDKAKKEIDQLKAEHREAIRELKAENRQLKSDAQSQVAAAVREYRQQNNAMTREMKKTYERQLKEVRKGYEKFRSQAESLSSESTMQYQNEFYNALMGTENLGKAKIPELRKKFRELAVENSGKDMDARKARQAEYTRLLDEFLTSRDIGKLRTTIQEQRDRAKAKVEAARVTEQRGKLYRAVNEINRRLLNPTKTLYVPDSLAPAVTKFMQGLTEAMESPKNSWNVQGALETLQGQYQKLTQMNEGVFTQEYNQGILDLLDNAISAVGGTDFNKLSASQIEDVYSAVRSVLTAIRNENKMFAANLNKTYAEAAEAVRREEAALPNRKPTTGAVQDKAEKFGWNQLKPVYAMMRLGSDTLLKQYNNLRAGEDKWQRTIAAARAYGLGIMEKYHYDQWNDSLMKLDTETGTVELSLEERMSLYAYARREQAFEHLTKGGFVLSDENTRTVKNRFGIETEQT